VRPRVTVIVATYDSSATLRCALDSVRRQELTDFEVWVIGDACTDDSPDVVAGLGDDRFHWFNRGRNSGSQSAPNMDGLARARGEYVAYLGHDDLWFPWHLSTLVDCITGSGAALVHSLTALVAADGPRELAGPAPSGVPYGLHFVPPSCWLHRHGVVCEIGGWRPAPELARATDIDVLARVVAAGHVVAGTRTLGVLKFPSQWWGTYARRGVPPQRAYLERMVAAPRELERDVLRDLAVVYSRNHSHLRARTARGVARQIRATARDVAAVARRGLADAYGMDRWPLRAILRWRFQRIRRRLRTRRGL